MDHSRRNPKVRDGQKRNIMLHGCQRRTVRANRAKSLTRIPKRVYVGSTASTALFLPLSPFQYNALSRFRILVYSVS